METATEDRFGVFVRQAWDGAYQPEAMERLLVSCPTYEEARWVRQENSGPGRECIIRYLGPAGGGD